MWATTTNQTPLSTEPQRVLYNTWVRAGCPIDPDTLAAVPVGTGGALLAGTYGHPITDFLDNAAAVESSLNSGLWLPAKRVTTGSITSASSSITSAGANFQSANMEAGGDLGSAFALAGAGPSGAPLVANFSGISNSTTALSGAAASTTVTNAALVIGPYTGDGIHPTSDGYEKIGKDTPYAAKI